MCLNPKEIQEFQQNLFNYIDKAIGPIQKDIGNIKTEITKSKEQQKGIKEQFIKLNGTVASHANKFHELDLQRERRVLDCPNAPILAELMEANREAKTTRELLEKLNEQRLRDDEIKDRKDKKKMYIFFSAGGLVFVILNFVLMHVIKGGL